jgi:ABC-type multidrug transport system fused ATPase/permease subunit
MDFKLIFKIFTKHEKYDFIGIILVLFFAGCIELVGVGSLGPFIAIVSNPQIIHTNAILHGLFDYFQFKSDVNFITVSGITLIVIMALSNSCLSGMNYILYKFSATQRHLIATRLLEKYLRQSYIFYLNVNTAEISKKILGDVFIFTSAVLLPILQLISGLVISLSILVLLIFINPILAVIISIVLSVSYLLIFYFVRKILSKKGAEQFIINTLRYKYINETFGGIKDIKILGKEKIFLDSITEQSEKSTTNDATSDIINDLPKYLIETISISVIISLIIIMISNGSKIDEFLPVLTVYVFGAYKLLPLFQKIFKAITSIRYNYPIVENIYHDLRELPSGIALTSSEIERMNFHRNIRLENIIFSYPGTNKEIIKNQSITIAVNTSVALVGSTGCGKTTFADIILGLLEPQSGKIFIDDVEIDDFNRKNWQQNLGYVPQTIYLTDDTIRNNIAFGVESSKIDDNAVIHAAKMANIHDFIMNELKFGYDTIIGERGIRLSGGQRQRIGIARAVYHNPSVLILDEATSALDTLTENAIMDAIKNLSRKKTIIMIAHRITTVKNCDAIYLIDKGIIADQGSYEELYDRNKIFRKMADGI